MVKLDRLVGALGIARRPPRIYLHIGAMKTGTTYLQHVLEANRDELAAAGYLFPGVNWKAQALAAGEVLGFPRARRRERKTWDCLVREMLAHEGEAAIFSHEWLSYADAERARKVIDYFPGREVHVILTVRDISRALPSQWQTSCRNAGVIPLPRLVAAMERALQSTEPPRTPAQHLFQRTQDVVRMLDVWAPLVGRKRIHVVTVPPPGSDRRLLWERFAAAVGIDPALAPREPQLDNATVLGHPTSEFLRRLNARIRDFDRADPAAQRVLYRLRADLAVRNLDEPPVRLHRRGLRLAARWNRRVRSAIRSHGVDVVGDLADLPVRPPAHTGPAPLASPSAEQMLRVAAAARDSLVQLEAELRSRLLHPVEAAPHSGTAGPGDDGDRPTGPDRWSEAAEPLASALQEVTARFRTCVRLSAQGRR